MTERLEEIKELLRKHDYLAVVVRQDDGCRIAYPHAKFLGQHRTWPRIIQRYTMHRGENPGCVIDDNRNVETSDFVAMPEYAMRIFVICDMSLTCQQIGLNPEMIDYFDGQNNRVETMRDVIDPPGSEEGLNKEGFLYVMITEGRKDGFPEMYEKIAVDNGVSEGYQLLRRFF